jgi:hypothetical protein
MTRFGYITAILAASVLAFACTDSLKPNNTGTDPSGGTSGLGSDTFDHDNTQISPWALLQRIEIEGPPEFTAHMAGCVKPRYHTLGNILTSLGVNIASTTNLSAGELWQGGYQSLGGPNYPARVRENINITTSAADKEFDIFAAAAPEIQAAFTAGTIAACPGAVMFDANGCNLSGIECLAAGVPTSSDVIQYCNLTVSGASTTAIGQAMAVAAILAATYTCE